VLENPTVAHRQKLLPAYKDHSTNGQDKNAKRTIPIAHPPCPLLPGKKSAEAKRTPASDKYIHIRRPLQVFASIFLGW
jgi:hypothetical protein